MGTVYFSQMDRDSRNQVKVSVLVNGIELCMKIDTEASVSIISESTKSCLFPDIPLSDSPAILKMNTQKRYPY